MRRNAHKAGFLRTRRAPCSEAFRPAAGGVQDMKGLYHIATGAVGYDIGCARDDKLAGVRNTPCSTHGGVVEQVIDGRPHPDHHAIGSDGVVLGDKIRFGGETAGRPA